MSDYNIIVDKVNKFIVDKLNDGFILIRSNCSTDELWEVYLESVKKHGLARQFKEREMHDCNLCKSFFKKMSNVLLVKFEETKRTVYTIWHINTDNNEYAPVIEDLRNYVIAHTQSSEITDFFITERQMGFCTKENSSMIDGTLVTFKHFYVDVHELDKHGYVSGVPAISLQEAIRMLKDTFSLVEYIKIVIDNLDAIYNAMQFKSLLEKVLKAYSYYAQEKDNYYLLAYLSKEFKEIVRFKNTAIAQLFKFMKEGDDLETAVTKYEKIVAPENYKRPKPIVTPAMLKEAEKFLEENGLEESIPRRNATIEDLTVGDVLYVNRNVVDVQDNTTFLGMKINKVKSTEKIKIDEESIPTLTIDQFLDKLMNFKNIELFESRQISNNKMVLVAPVNKEAPSLFKWGNNFSWNFAKGLAGVSKIKERVREKGGKVEDIDLRVSLNWHSSDDLDLHCIIDSDKGRYKKVYYGNKLFRIQNSIIHLDVDMNVGTYGKEYDPINPVENIYVNDKLKNLKLEFLVNNFTKRTDRNQFIVEMEYDKEIRRYKYNKVIKARETIKIFSVRYDENGNINIIQENKKLDVEIESANEGKFIPLSLISYSPNYWENSKGIGPTFIFLFSPLVEFEESINGFFNEFLDDRFRKYRKVFEIIKDEFTVKKGKPLAGYGFLMDDKDSTFIVRITDNKNRKQIFKIVIGG